MPLNPLAPVTDYQSMLNRIFWFTTAAALAAVWLLRSHVPGIESSLAAIDMALTIDNRKPLPLPAGYLLPALAVGIAARVFRLHTRMSDWLGIREHFDVDVILRAFADELGVDVSQVDDIQFCRARPHLMRKAFYAYTGTQQPAIDRPLVEQALDAWSWYWIGLEASLVAALTGYALIASSAYRVGFETLGAAAAFLALGLPVLWRQCVRYALAQVHAILDDEPRAAQVRAIFTDFAAKQAPPLTAPRLAA
jgi:hypothetical protein